MNIIIKGCTILLMAGIISCNAGTDSANTPASSSDTTAVSGGQEKINDNVSAKDIIKVAASSKDHTTLVAALKQADLVTSLSNAGPFTVFAPTNAAFVLLPAGTVENLLKDANKEELRNVLQYHVSLGVFKTESLQDGQSLGMVNGDNVTVQVRDGKITLNNSAHIIASIRTSNGIIHVIDGVLLPPSSKK